MAIPFPPIDWEASRARAAARRAAALASMGADPLSFIGTSLAAWLGAAAAAGVPAVPGEVIYTLPRATFMGMEAPTAEDETHWRAMSAQLKALPEDHMARWDCCASADVKSAMGHPGGTLNPEFRDLSPDDPRAFDLVYDYPSDDIPILSRPWLEAMRIDGFPVEFRVFVRDSVIQGVASYYPQRALPDTEEIAGYVRACGEAAQKVVDHLMASGLYPWLPNFEGKFERGHVHCTMDFLVPAGRQMGEVLFLEAGPPFGAGAHPCAFLGRHDNIQGVALALEPGVELR